MKSITNILQMNIAKGTNDRAQGIKTPTQFVAEVEKIVKEKRMNYLDACLEYARTANVEIETIASLIKGSQTLKSKIQLDAEAIRMLKPTSGAKLPL
jgi:predicted transcriptional regulator